MTTHGGIYGDVSVQFQDVIFTLEERALTLTDPSDLSDLRVVAFQNASKHYSDWLSPLQDSANYTETADQSLQVKMLHRGRADAIVADLNIVQYLTKLVAEELGGPDYISLNHYALRSGARLKPCEMPEAKVRAFVLNLIPDP